MEVVENTSNAALSSVTERVLAASGVLAISAGSAFVAYFNPTHASLFPVCPLFKLTGFACPGCGLTRGFHALFHGDVLTALGFNALLPAFALMFGYIFLALVLVAVRGRGLPTNFIRAGWLYGFLAVAITFTILRNLPYYPFSVLFP
jgi:hypothetical protein